jgi:hypothetical protein
MALNITDNKAEQDLEGKVDTLPFRVEKGATDAPGLLSIHHIMENSLQHSMIVCHVLPMDRIGGKLFHEV